MRETLECLSARILQQILRGRTRFDRIGGAPFRGRRPPSLVDQIVLNQFLVEGHFARHLRRMRTVHEARRSALVDALREQLGQVLQIVGADAGSHCTAILNPRWSDVTVANEAAVRGCCTRHFAATTIQLFRSQPRIEIL